MAVDNVSFDVVPGEVLTIIGPNGAGKSTLFNVISRIYPESSGQLFFEGVDLGQIPPHQIANLGIARTFQNIRLFHSLSSLENVVVGGFLRHKTVLGSALCYLPSAIKETDELKAKAMELLELVDLADVANTRSRDLPYGKQRRLEIARALATQPKLLLLDEPAAGMNPQEKMELLQMVKKIRDVLGVTVLLIEHDMKFVMNLCERILVLDHGEEIAQGPPAEIRSNPKVIAAYLGEAV